MTGRPPSADRGPIAGVVLAGGRSSRMGGLDKGLIELGGLTLVERARDRLAPQVARVALSANDAAPYARFAMPVRPDTIAGRPGPLAGVLAAMAWAADALPDAAHILSVAVDTPFFPADLAQRLAEAGGGGIAVAASGERAHPVFALWPVALAADIEAYLRQDARRAVYGFLDRHRHAIVDFPPDAAGRDPFFNINTPQDLAEARRLRDLSAM